jgi:hypothetical protein
MRRAARPPRRLRRLFPRKRGNTQRLSGKGTGPPPFTGEGDRAKRGGGGPRRCRTRRPSQPPAPLPRRRPGPIANRGEARGSRNKRPQSQHLLQHAPRQAPRITMGPGFRRGSKKGKAESQKRQSGSQPGKTKYLSPPAPTPSYSPTATSAEGRDRYRPASFKRRNRKHPISTGCRQWRPPSVG